MMIENKQYLTVTAIQIETPIAGKIIRGTPEIEYFFKMLPFYLQEP